MVGRGINGVYRCQKIIRICGELVHWCTHQPFCLEADVASEGRGRRAFRE